MFYHKRMSRHFLRTSLITRAWKNYSPGLLCLCLCIPVYSQPSVRQRDFECGRSFTDPRDGSSYETVLIGDQCWMKRNLNAGVMIEAGSPVVSESGITKFCYGDDPSNCETYGALYTWEQAMVAQHIQENQGVCPPGWHIPSREEWEELAGFLGRDEAGQKLKASQQDQIPWDGTNESGFTAIPAGAGDGEGFQRLGDWALFWSSTEYDKQRAWFAQVDGYWYEQPPKYKILYIGHYYLKSNVFSIRCILDKH